MLGANLLIANRRVCREDVKNLNVAWIQNTTLRENVLFGREWDEHRYWTAIKNASLLPDLEILPDGDLTEVRRRFVGRPS